MKIRKKREIVIEFECVRLVRKKALTHLTACRLCGREVDFLSVREAASLFSTPVENLLSFGRAGGVHFEIGAHGEIDLCLVSFLAAMKAKTGVSGIKLKGGKQT